MLPIHGYYRDYLGVFMKALFTVPQFDKGNVYHQEANEGDFAGERRRTRRVRTRLLGRVEREVMACLYKPVILDPTEL